MRIVISGAAGFIGSHLAERFLTEGHVVIGIDNLITGQAKNIELLKQHESFSFIQQDVASHVEIDGNIDRVLHFASAASPPDYLRMPVETLRTGSVGTENLLTLAKEKHARFLLASTSEVYGDPLVHPQTEQYWGNVNPVGPRSVYDEAKRYAEAITTAYGRTHDVDIRIVRIFNTYGPRMRANDGRVVTNFINQALRNEPLTIYGDGSQTRSFCYIDDEVEGILDVLASDYRGPVNVGNPDEFTVKELADLVLRMVDTKSTVINEPLPEDDPKCRKPDISLVNKLSGWQPKIDLETGLRSTIEYFASQLTSTN